MSKICSAHLGNGLAIWRKGEDNFIAHITPYREIKYRAVNLTRQEKAIIRKIAATDDREISATQTEKVFKIKPLK